MCKKSSSSWGPSPWAWGLVFWLLASSGLPGPATAQSTPPEPGLPSSPPSGEWSLSKASSELVRRLTERSAEVTSLQGSLRTSEECWAEAERKLTEQASTLDSLRTDLQETSSSLAESRKQSADYRTAVADQLRLDQEAINQGRAERDAWRAGAVTGGIVAVVAAVVVVFR